MKKVGNSSNAVQQVATVKMGHSGNSKRLSIRAILSDGTDVTSQITYMTLNKAYKAGKNLQVKVTKGGNRWVQVDPTADIKSHTAPPVSTTTADPVIAFEAPSVVLNEVAAQLVDIVSKRPADLVCDDLTWKVICRSTLRGSNTLLLGPSGTGKTKTAFSVAKALNKTLFYMNLGSTQDPRGTLIGNTHFSKEAGTFFNESAFVRAIQTPDTVIVLDELSRAHPEAWNILMTVLDSEQKYLRLDEAVGSPTVHVHPSVAFIATANVGSEYTAVRVMDRALLDRFTMNEIPFLTPSEEKNLILSRYPGFNEGTAGSLAKLAEQTRIETQTENPRLQTPVSTRVVLEIAGMIVDGFTLEQCANVSIYPLYSRDGGLQSERTFIKQLVQRYIVDGTADNLVDGGGDAS